MATSQINPIVVAAGIRHFSANDELSSVAISNPTRDLEARDNSIASKLNEVISTVNNKEQVISVPIPRLTIPAGNTFIAQNFRIPSGYEARILTATIYSSVSGIGKLDILYSSNTFGLTTGTSILTTTSENTVGTNFCATGELIIKFTNTGTVKSDYAAALIISMRPVGDQNGTLLGPGAIGPRGYKGLKGDAGDQGSQGPQGLGVYIGTVPPLVTNVVWYKIDNTSQMDGEYVYVPSPLFSWYTKMPNRIGDIRLINDGSPIGLGWQALSAAAGLAFVASGTASGLNALNAETSPSVTVTPGSTVTLNSSLVGYGVSAVVFTGINCFVNGQYAYKRYDQSW